MKQSTLPDLTGVLRFAAVAWLGLGLQGCGLSSMTSGIGGGIMGGGSSQSATPNGVNEDQLLTAAKSEGDLTTGAVPATAGCPAFLIWAREKHHTVYEAERVGDALAIVHQGEITRVARECSFEPGRITIRYGFSGRLLLGPKGQPGIAQLPVQVFVTDPNREKVHSDVVTVSVSVPPDIPISYFSSVRTISIPIKEGSRPSDYKIYVGFDKSPPAEAATAQAPKKRPRS